MVSTIFKEIQTMIAREFENNYMKTYQKFSYPMLKYIFYIVNDWDVCKDILQDTFLKLYEKRIELDPEGSTTFTFLCRVSRNTAFDYIKKLNYEYKNYIKMHYDEVCEGRSFYDDVEDIYIEGEVVSTLHDTINTFPEVEKEVLIRNIFHNQSISEISAANEMSKYMIRQIMKKFTYHVITSLRSYFIEDME